VVYGLTGIHIVLVVLKHGPCCAFGDFLHQTEEFIAVNDLIEGSSEKVHEIEDLTWLDLTSTDAD
jgi:hypothetical protein